MKRHNLLFAFLLMSLTSWAQKLTVEGMTLVDDDQSAVTEKRTDVSESPCALVKVQLDAEGAAFGGNVIPPADYRNGEYWVYMTEGSYLLQVKHPQYQPLMVNFRDYGVSTVVPLKTYRLKIGMPKNQVTTGVLNVNYTPFGTDVYIDGFYIGKAPLIKRDVSPGSHKIVMRRQNCVTVRKDITVIAGETVYLEGIMKRPEETPNMTAGEMTALGIAYETGVGMGKDIEQALKWLNKAADQGDADAMVELGWMYEYGKVVNKNLAEAVKWYRKAADMGDSEGQWRLGSMYYKGLGGLRLDYAEAASLYRKAAEQNNAGGLYFLAMMHYDGVGVKKDRAQAMPWFRKAAEQDHSAAQYYLGMCYENGYGVSKDKAQALYWYKKSADNGYYDARDSYNRLK